jgi:hypothetical protein
LDTPTWSGALGADWTLRHLHHELLTLLKKVADWGLPRRTVATALVVCLGLVVALLFGSLGGEKVFDVKKGGAVETDVDEGGLHPGKHARHAAEVDVSDRGTMVAALDVELAQDAIGD